MTRARRGVLGVLAVGLGAALLVGALWLAAREAPSAGRDPNLTSPVLVGTRAAATPEEPALPEAP